MARQCPSPYLNLLYFSYSLEQDYEFNSVFKCVIYKLSLFFSKLTLFMQQLNTDLYETFEIIIYLHILTYILYKFDFVIMFYGFFYKFNRKSTCSQWVLFLNSRFFF